MVSLDEWNKVEIQVVGGKFEVVFGVGGESVVVVCI